MKRYRIALCGLILLMVLVMLSGCHAEYECTIKFKEGTEAEGMLKEIDGVRKSAPLRWRCRIGAFNGILA